MQKRLIAVVSLVLALAAIAFAADDPFTGTWKLNVAKSKFNPGPPPQSSTITFEPQDRGFKFVGDGVNSDGKAIHQEGSVKFDGKDYPVTGAGVPPDMTIAVRMIDTHTRDFVGKRGGKEGQRGQDVISKDGKTLTRTTKGQNAQGQKYNNVLVYDKQ
jgi:hypothetical protein